MDLSDCGGDYPMNPSAVSKQFPSPQLESLFETPFSPDGGG